MDTRDVRRRQTATCDVRRATQVRTHMGNVAARCGLYESRCEAKASRSSTPNNTAETTNVRCNTTYQRILSFAVPWAFMKMRSRWMEEIATIEAATLSFSVPE